MSIRTSWFAAHYDRLMSPLEKKSFAEIRRTLLAKASGDVLEIGCGTGIHFHEYRDVRVTAIEPSAVMRETAIKRTTQAKVPIQVLEGSAEALPFPDQSFDTVVGTLVFCTIPNPRQAVREMKRVCKPAGKILLFEHVRHDNRMLAALQDVLTPVWKRMCDGCHLNRDTLSLLKQEGLEIVHMTTHLNKIFVTVEANRQ